MRLAFHSALPRTCRRVITNATIAVSPNTQARPGHTVGGLCRFLGRRGNRGKPRYTPPREIAQKQGLTVAGYVGAANDAACACRINLTDLSPSCYRLA